MFRFNNKDTRQRQSSVSVVDSEQENICQVTLKSSGTFA